MSPEHTGDILRVSGTDGCPIEVCRHGNGPPILMIHGWTLDRRSFDLQVPALSRAMTVLTYDRRGFGRSQATPDLAADQADIDRILDALGLDHAHILGVSQGGRIALRYAATRAQRVSSLILQGAPLDGFVVEEPEAAQIPLGRYQALARDGHMDTVRREWLQHPLMSSGINDSALKAMLTEIVSDYSGADLTTSAPPLAAQAPDVIAALAGSDLPTLVISGALETPGRRAHAAKICALMPHAREIVLAHSGHLSNLSEPETYSAAVLRFCLGAEASR